MSMDSSTQYLGMRQGDLDGKPYAQFWRPEMSAMQPHVAEAVLHGEQPGELGFGLEDAERLLEPGCLPLENGFARLSTGQVQVAVRTQMPGVTGEMFEWWMGWHTSGTPRHTSGTPEVEALASPRASGQKHTGDAR